MILGNLSAHRATDVLFVSLAHKRWEFVVQSVYAAYLDLIEPWWKVLCSLALEGRPFESWAEIERAGARGGATGTPSQRLSSELRAVGAQRHAGVAREDPHTPRPTTARAWSDAQTPRPGSAACSTRPTAAASASPVNGFCTNASVGRPAARSA